MDGLNIFGQAFYRLCKVSNKHEYIWQTDYREMISFSVGVEPLLVSLKKDIVLTCQSCGKKANYHYGHISVLIKQ